MSDVLEGWAIPVSEQVGPLKILDHTFVKAPNNGPAYFECFSLTPVHEGKNVRKLTSGNGDYSVANCYRLPDVLPDTAGLGLYATHGVCHQAANRFLYSACGWFDGPTVSDAHGYALSFSFYGTYGRPLAMPFPGPPDPNPSPPFGFLMIYAGCKGLAKTPPPADDRPEVAEGLPGIAALHSRLHTEEGEQDPNKTIDEELRLLVAAHLGAEFDFCKIREIRGAALSRAHKVATSDLRGAAFADEINAIAVQYLDEMEAHLGEDNHTALFKTTPKERYALVDPRLAEAAGTHGTGA